MFRIIKIFSYNHKYNFYQEYLRIFVCEINRYERTKEHMNANHKYDTRVKTKIKIEYLKKKKNSFVIKGKCSFLIPLSLAKILQKVSEARILT